MPESAGNSALSTDDLIDFGVLGPLRIAVGDTELELTAPSSRTFLAALVLNAGAKVSFGWLADVIWGADPPRNPRRAVQLCAVRVRARLEEVGAGHLVVTCPDGYRLAVPAERTDVGRVRDRLRAADTAQGAGDRELAAITAALDNWRGEPLADIPSESLQRQVVPGLVEQRLRLTERRVDLLLAAGRAAELVDDLVAFTARHPLRERLWAQLMESLHRCGRRGEALDAYHRFRRRLRDELGIDPGEAIRALHQTILTSRRDPEPDAQRTPLPVPRQLPVDSVAFTGRAKELALLDGLLATLDDSAGPVVGVITGTAGVGKTSLAVHWARGVADDFPDGQLFVSLRGYHREQALTPDRVLGRFLRALGVRGEDIPEDIEELAATYRSIMDGRRMLIVLDNAGNSDQVRPLLPSSAGCLVLVTSRDVLLGLIASVGAGQVRLELPGAAEARQMLARRIGPDRLAAETQAADDIISASARLPLAIAIAAAHAVSNHDSRLSALAAQLHSGLDAFGAASTETDVRVVFSWSYRALSRDAARLLRLLGLHPGPDISVAAAASLGGVAPTRAGHLIAELVRANLLIEHVPGRYALHDLMREYCVELAGAAETRADRNRIVRRTLDHYLHTGHTAAAIFNPQRVVLVPGEVPAVPHPEAVTDHDSAMAWFTAEAEVLLTLVDWAVATGHDRQAWQLAVALTEFLELQGAWAQWIGSQRTALAAAERLGDPALEAFAHRGIGRAHTKMRRTEDAHRHYAKALELYRETDDRTGESLVLTSLAILHDRQDQCAQALEYAERALELEKRLNRTNCATTLNLVAWCLARVGQHEKALDHARQARAQYRRIGDATREADALHTIGYAHHQLGQFPEAVDNYHRAIRINRRLGERYYTAEALIKLGDTYESMDDLAGARDSWRQAESILDELQHPDAEQARRRLATVADPS